MVAPRFSVLLPTHDRADVVGYAIRSVLDQSDQDLELLVVGDGCTDDTGSVVRGFGDPRIRWFDLPKAPHFGYANRNVALREASGELVAFMAHDDLVLPDHLERLGALFSEPTVEWAYSRPAWVSDDGIIVPFAVDLRDPVQLGFFLDVANSIPASCVMYRRSCLDRYGFWPEDVPSAGDWEHWKAIIRPSAGSNLAYLPAVTALHFRASWRDSGRWGPEPLHRWLDVAADRRRWPRRLYAVLADGEPPQASILKAIEEDRDGWTSAIRDGVSVAIDLLAWSQAGDLSRVEGELEQARAQAERWRQEAEISAGLAEASARTADAAVAEARMAREELSTLLTSRSWRLTAPLRRARAPLRR
jgi:hypothetical protein